MAIEKIIVMRDDLDSSEIPEGGGGEVSFAFKGQRYEMHLTTENEQKLADALRPFIEKARKVDSTKEEASHSEGGDEKPYDLRDARRWLREQGYELNQVGPLKAEFRKIYEEAHGLPPWK
ncbi:hypothetical protein GCM10017576_23320 [Microbacterium barkeri]|uniref:Lsr2 dimerization domain-containing protein n=1 Tax=Microbacterium barkeri TaxID=33917 RepID=A0A9W6LX84_9MICO|nr:histone-like nucleoid-structuring protein Lsr2 [Microbacterium barkeri]MDI6944189.1 Lsr2 family protein [Microbacterium barkeri]MDR6876761.1 hypothetical protein [Microbacterium barkeri]GLJ62202.1 hypothetical protein GCM10017576_23320 [Microbacterium barkeri]